MPDIIPVSESQRQVCNEIIYEKFDYPVSLAISNNDLMFLFWLHQTGSVDESLLGYFRSGVIHGEIIRRNIADFFDSNQRIKILDFASGHGRVSRFLPAISSVDKVAIADIKPSAVSFQQETLGFDGFVVPEHPEELKALGESPDMIIVSSLFTHLNNNLFGRWINSLAHLLKPGGVLAVSIHLLDTNEEPEFLYREKSEEDIFPEISDNLAGRKIYGLTHLNMKSFSKILDGSFGPKYSIIKRQDWGDSQVLFSIRKEG
jgi:SAM-dependent methyltransferase